MSREAECPTCNAYVPIDSDIKEGDHIYCSYCMARLVVTRAMLEDDEDGRRKEIEVEEDWD